MMMVAMILIADFLTYRCSQNQMLVEMVQAQIFIAGDNHWTEIIALKSCFHACYDR